MVSALLGCAALPDDAPVTEQLDEETGLTVARLGHPMELYRETIRGNTAGKFAFAGPFETNSMGARASYFWLALPVDAATSSEPVFEIDGKVIALGTAARGADFAGLRNSPYKIPTPWSAMYYYKIDSTVIALLGAASELTVRVTETTSDGTSKTVFASKVADSRLKDFAAR
jgi:hypothetical protein